MNEKLELGDKALNSGAVRRTVKVLEAFTSKDKWGVRELAAHLDIPKSGLHRILQDMAVEGLVVTTMKELMSSARNCYLSRRALWVPSRWLGLPTDF